MARLRPFRGVRYTLAAGELGLLLAPPSSVLTPGQRDGYAARSPHNAVAIAYPEGHGDDRSRFIRYARSAARLAEWRREGFLAPEERPAFYRLTQRFGSAAFVRTVLLAVVDPATDLEPAELADARIREDRLRLLEATRTAFEPTVAFYEDGDGRKRDLLRTLPASSESAGSLDGTQATLETIDDPDAVESVRAAFDGAPLLLADNVEGYEAARDFPGGTGVLLALASLDDASYARLAVHRVLRRLPGGTEGALTRLAERFEIEEHHNRNLASHIDRAASEGRTVFGMATEGGRGYLLISRETIDGPAAMWLQREIVAPLLGVAESDPTLAFTDPLQAIRAADEGAAAAIILPQPGRSDLREAKRLHTPLPARSTQTYPSIPTGLVFWSMGDDA